MSANITATGPAVRTEGQVRPRSRLRRVLITLASVLVALLVVAYFGVSAYAIDKMSHPARNPATHTPTDFGMQYEDIQFNTAEDNIALKGWFIDSPGNKTVLLLHGRDFSREANGGLEKAAALVGHDYDVYMFDFRAHGASAGDRYSLGVWETRDVAGALDFMKSRGVTEAGIYGISMGGATAIMSAAQHPEFKAVVSESAYSDLPTLLDELFPEKAGLPSFFMPGVHAMSGFFGMDFNKARPAESLKTLGERPVLLIHSKADKMVNMGHFNRLVEASAANPNLSTWVVDDAPHADGFVTYKQEYTERMLAFYDKNLK